MPKGYWIARIDVADPEIYKRYVTGAVPAFEKYGAKFLARGGTTFPMEGTNRSRNVIIEFPSAEAARQCWNSPEYQAAREHRLPVSTGEIVIVEGLPD